MKKPKIYFIASINERNIDDIKNIAHELEIIGCFVDSILPITGIITGSTSSDTSIDQLKIDGIENIEISKEIQSFQ